MDQGIKYNNGRLNEWMEWILPYTKGFNLTGKCPNFGQGVQT